jgi:uncharacterized integral membrane protein
MTSSTPDPRHEPSTADSGGPTPSPVEDLGPDAPTRPSRHPGLDDHGRVKRTRAGALYAAMAALAVITALFVVFVLQNADSTQIRFLWMEGNVPVAAALLLAAVVGAVLMAVPATIRMSQLRHSLKLSGRQG